MPDPNSTQSFPPTRSSLLSRVRDPNDVEGWGEFHDQYRGLVARVCAKAGLNPEDAQDVAQEAMASVAQAMPTFKLDRTKGTFRGWLYRITSNKVNDFLRRKYRESQMRGPMPRESTNEIGEEMALIEKAWETEWEQCLLQRALERVKDRTSSRALQIFHLSAVNQWSIEQICATLNLGRTSVYLARYRVGLLVKKEVARLREELG